MFRANGVAGEDVFSDICAIENRDVRKRGAKRGLPPFVAHMRRAKFAL
jgi:hypothetical protein